jgi:uncharacterized membrane protein
MAGGHAHAQRGSGAVAVGKAARVVLLVLLSIAAAATIFGVVKLWPEASAVKAASSDVEFSAPGVTYPQATITGVQPACPEIDGDAKPSSRPGAPPACGQFSVRLESGPEKGTKVLVPLPGPQAEAGLRPGDGVELQRIPAQRGEPAIYSLFGVDRGKPILVMAGLFVLVVVAVARVRGLLALLGLGFSGLVVVKFMLPSLLSGEPGLAVAVVGASAIMFVVLYVAHGPSIRTSTALAGTLAGLGITAAIGHAAIDTSRLSGISDETALQLQSLVGNLEFRGLLDCAIIVAGLGILNDVTITQASAVWELRAAGPQLSRRAIFSSGMRIGRDHIASTIYTIVFAYAGAALSILLVLYLYDRPVLDLLGTEEIATEVVRILASGIGLVLAVPITTAISAAALTPGADPAEPTT